MNSELLSIEQFMEQANIGRTKTYQEINEGRLAAKKIGKKTVIHRSSMEQWAKSLPDYQAKQAA